MAKVKESEVGAMTTANWVNIIILGAGFMLLFTAFQTTAFVQVRRERERERERGGGERERERGGGGGGEREREN